MVLLLHEEIAPNIKFTLRTLTVKVLLCALALCASAPLLADESTEPNGTTTDQAAGATPSSSNWRVGFSVGALTHQSLDGLFYQIEIPSFHSSYLVDLDGVYTLHRFQILPIDLEVQGEVAKRFGMDHQSEVDLISVVRWKKFPWNDKLYTNFRFGFLGGSYVSSISPWEKQDSGNNTGSKFLQLLIAEFTFSPSENAGYEGFIGLHHRSGIFGLISGVTGGSNYFMVGMRFRTD
jgi:hypothetical protein